MRGACQFILVAIVLSQSQVWGQKSDSPNASPPGSRFSGQLFPIAEEGPESFSGLLVLDDRDEGLDATAKGDVLSLLNDAGEITWATGGFGICETVGGVHRLAVDSQRRRIYVAENLARRITALDFAGRRCFEIVGMDASAIAVDEKWGHVWVSGGKMINSGETLVFDSEGTLLNTLPFRGVDLVGAMDADGVWMSGSHLRRVNAAGEIVFERKISGWCVPTLCRDDSNACVWAGERSHPDVASSANRIWRVRSTGEADLKVDLHGCDPYTIILKEPGVTWAGGYNGLYQVSARGELGLIINVKVKSLESKRRGDGAYVASENEILMLSNEGEIISRQKWPRATTLLAR